MPVASAKAWSFARLSADELAEILRLSGTRDNGWFLAAALMRCCRATCEAVRLWRAGVTELSFAGCEQLDDAALSRVSATCGPRLRAIDVANCARITDNSIAMLVGASHSLQRLKLSKCQGVGEDTLSSIAYGPCARALQRLDLSSCRYSSQKGVVSICEECHNLLHLDLSYCAVAIADNVLTTIARSPMPLLQALLLKASSGADAKGLTDDGIEALASSAAGRALTHLDVTHATRLTNESMRSLATHCHALRILSVHECTRISDAGVVLLAEGCAQLERLDLTRLQIGASSLAALSKGCPGLTSLTVDHCHGLDEAGWDRLSAEGPSRLEWLSAVWAGGLADPSLRRLVESCAPLALRFLRLGPAHVHPEISPAAFEELKQTWAGRGLTIVGGPQLGRKSRWSKKRTG